MTEFLKDLFEHLLSEDLRPYVVSALVKIATAVASMLILWFVRDDNAMFMVNELTAILAYVLTTLALASEYFICDYLHKRTCPSISKAEEKILDYVNIFSFVVFSLIWFNLFVI